MLYKWGECSPPPTMHLIYPLVLSLSLSFSLSLSRGLQNPLKMWTRRNHCPARCCAAKRTDFLFVQVRLAVEDEYEIAFFHCRPLICNWQVGARSILLPHGVRLNGEKDNIKTNSKNSSLNSVLKYF